MTTWTVLPDIEEGDLGDYEWANDVKNDLTYLKEQIEAITAGTAGGSMFTEFGLEFPYIGETTLIDLTSPGTFTQVLYQGETINLTGAWTVLGSPTILLCKTLNIGPATSISAKGKGALGGGQSGSAGLWGDGGVTPFSFRYSGVAQILDCTYTPQLLRRVLGKGGAGGAVGEAAPYSLNPASLWAALRFGLVGGGGGGKGGVTDAGGSSGEGGMCGAGGISGTGAGAGAGGGSGVGGGGGGGAAIAASGTAGKGGNGGGIIIILAETIASSGGGLALTLDVSGNDGENGTTAGGGGGGGAGAGLIYYKTKASGMVFTVTKTGGAAGTGDNSGGVGGAGYEYIGH